MVDPVRTIRELFKSSTDHARSVGPLTPAGRALLLLSSLRFFAAVGTHSEEEDPWHRIRNQTAQSPPSSQAIESALAELAGAIETQQPQLEGVFAEWLIPSLRGVEDLLIPWIIELDTVGASLRANAKAFALWFDSTVDHTIGKGVPGLQYTTPRAVAKLMVDLAAPRPGESIHDPCAGSGGLLAAAFLETNHIDKPNLLSGQEANAEIAALARLRLCLLGARGIRIKTGDVLRHPLFIAKDSLETFDVVLCDPPYGQRLANNDFAQSDRYGRFRHGPPGRTSSEMAFFQHAVACLNKNGRAVALTAHGPLFRGGADAHVRANMIREDLIETVVGMPAGVLPGVSTEFALICCRRVKPESRRGQILFIDGSEQRDALRHAHAWENFTRMITSQDEAASGPLLTCRVPISDVVKNGFSLQPRRYVVREKGDGSIDINNALLQAAAYEKEAAVHATRIDRLIGALEKNATVK